MMTHEQLAEMKDRLYVADTLDKLARYYRRDTYRPVTLETARSAALTLVRRLVEDWVR